MYIDNLCKFGGMADIDPGALGSDLLGVAARLSRWATSQAQLPVPSAQARLLALIEAIGPAKNAELAAADHCSQPTMTIQLQKLAGLELIRRVPHPGDSRATLVSLTRKGAAALDRTRRARQAAIAPHLAALSTAERTRLAAAVEVLRGITDRLPNRSDTAPNPEAADTDHAETDPKKDAP